MGKKASATKGGSVKTSAKKATKVLPDNQTIIQTSSVRKKDREALKSKDRKKT